MAQNQKPPRKWPRLILNWVITIALVVTANATGAAFHGKIPHCDIWYGITSISLIVLLAGSIVASFAFNKKMNRMKIRDINDLTESRRNRIRSDAGKETRRLQRACILAVIYLILLAVLALAMCFFSGAYKPGQTTASVISLYVLYGFVARCTVKRNKIDYSHALSEQDYPLLYRLARQAAGNPDANIHIFPAPPSADQECNASVAQEGAAIHLLLGPMLLNILSREELYQVLRHEFAHIDLAHPRQLARYGALMDFLAGDDDGMFGFWTSWAMSFPISYLYLEGQYYFLFSSHGKETLADEIAGSSGDTGCQASALAKIAAHGLFVYEQEPYACFYAPETPTAHFATDRIRAFRSALETREQDWRRIIENSIPSRVDTHPTFRQRWDALGMCDYSLTPCSAEDDYTRECRRFAELSDRKMQEIDPEIYRQQRKEYYLDHLETVRAFEEGGKLLPPEEMRPVIYGYYALAMPEKAEQLCDQLIAAYDSPFSTAFARYWKGILLLYRYDKAGLDYLYQAMETNTNFIEDSLDRIGRFCTMMGLPEELEEYRARALDFMQLKQDRDGGGITAKADLSPETLPEDWQERILGYILNIGGDRIDRVYLVKERLSDNFSRSAFILRYAEDTSDDQRIELYDQVFRLLDDWPVDWEFSLYDYEPSMEKPLKRVPGACIYGANP